MARNSTYFEYACPLNNRTYPLIIAYAERYNFHLAREYAQTMQYEAPMELYVNMVFDVARGVPETFGIFPGATFDACWHYGDGERGPFTRIFRNTYR